MTDIDLELNGVASLKTEIENIQRKGDGDAVYVVGSDRKYGVVLEFGQNSITPNSAEALKFEDEDGNTIFRKEVSIPPYPWFRPAIREFKANPSNFLLSNTDFGSIDDIDTTNELVASIAAALENQMSNNVSANKSVDRSPGTHPEHPQRDTGTLNASIQATRVR